MPIADLNDIVFGAWDVYPANAYESAINCEVLKEKDINPVKDELIKIVPMKAAFDKNYAKRLDGDNVKDVKDRWDMTEQIREDIRRFKKENGVDRVVVLWAASTEVYVPVDEKVHTLADLEAAMKADDKEHIAPSMCYAYAALKEGAPFIMGAPNTTVDIPRHVGAVGEDRHAHRRQGLQDRTDTREERLRTHHRQHAASASPDGSRPTYSATATDSCSTSPPTSAPKRFQSSRHWSRSSYPKSSPTSTPTTTTRCASTTIPAQRQQGGLGQHRHLRMDGLPHADQDQLPLPRLDPRRSLCLDLVLLSDLAARAGRHGTQRFLSFFLKSPMHDYTKGEVPVNHLFPAVRHAQERHPRDGRLRGRRGDRLISSLRSN